MKLDVSHLSGVPKAAPTSKFASVVIAAAEAGNSIVMADGRTYRVTGRSNTRDGVRLQLTAGKRTLSAGLQQIAAMQPLSAPMLRFASAMLRLLAVGPEFSEYVNAAIQAAGYPLDPTKNWAAWLNGAFFKDPRIRSLHVSPDVVDEQIHAMLIHELYTKKILQTAFNPEHASWADKPMEVRVSMFLQKTFKFRVSRVADAIRLEMGPGTGGDVGRMQTESLDEKTEDMHGQLQDTARTPRVMNTDVTDFEDDEELKLFLQAFAQHLKDTQTKVTVKAIGLMTLLVLDGADINEVQREFLESGLRNKKGEELDYNAFAHIRRRWKKLIREFATTPDYGFADTTIGRMIQHMTEEMDKHEKKEQREPAKAASAVPTLAGLHVADALGQNSPNLTPGISTPPVTSPPNPNVVQQNIAQQPAQPASPQGMPPQNESGFQQPSPSGADPTDVSPTPGVTTPGAPTQPAPGPKKTISPEIPGVNHTASLEKTMSKTAVAPRTSLRTPRQNKTVLAAAAAKAARFSRLRQVASEDAPEVEAALSELGDATAAFADSFSVLKDNLDLVTPDKTASIKEKTAAKRNYASTFRRLAEEAPEELAAAINEAYADADELTAAIENFADNLGIELVEPNPTIDPDGDGDDDVNPSGDDAVEDIKDPDAEEDKAEGVE